MIEIDDLIDYDDDIITRKYYIPGLICVDDGRYDNFSLSDLRVIDGRWYIPWSKNVRYR